MSETNGRWTIHTTGGPEELFRLREWVRSDDDLRGRIGLPAPPPRAGQMGDLSDVLMITARGGRGSALPRSLTAWPAHRRSEVSVARSDGAEVMLDAHRVKSTEVLRELRALFAAADNNT
ncbi:effector-associated constant component EACC1 [Nocardia sp. NPDC003963]